MDELPTSHTREGRDTDAGRREEEALNDEVTRLIDELPTMVARCEHAAGAVMDEAVEPAMAETALMDLDEVDDVALEPAADMPAKPEPAAPAVEATVLRPLPEDIGRPMRDSNIGVRRTRDYDHDAQSTNLASSADNFDTIREEHSKRASRKDPYARGARKGEAPGEGNSRSKLRPLLALFIIALVLGGGGAVLTYGMELWGGKSVPHVVGESQANAEARVREKGLDVVIEAEPADDAIGKVLRQEPESGVRIPEGDAVTLVIATNRTMPEVIGLSEEEARELLAEAGAANIETKTKSSSKAEGTVIDVSPAAGEAFVSRGVVTLTVAAPYRVPDVIGKKESDAVQAIEAEGFKADVSYVKSDETVRTVVETSPGPGETIGEGGTVKVKVSSPYPESALYLAEYFDHSSQDVDTYLQKEGYAFGKGYVDTNGNAVTAYVSDNAGNITFSSTPYSHTVSFPGKSDTNVLSTGTPFVGVRLDFPAWQVPNGYEQSAIDELVEQCGFKGQNDICNNASMMLPAGTAATSATFVCASGRMDNLVWTILIVGNNGSVRASATCAKEGIYSLDDLNPFGSSVAQFVAYQEVYLSPEYQVKEEKKDEKDKDSKDKDSKSDDKDDTSKDDEKKDEASNG